MERNRNLLVSDFLSLDFISITASTPLPKLAKKMLKMDMDSALVMDHSLAGEPDVPIGIIRHNDLLKKIMETYEAKGKNLDLNKIPSKEIMAKPLIYVFFDQPIWDALDLMYSKNLSILPVMDNHDNIRGVIRLQSILKNLA